MSSEKKDIQKMLVLTGTVRISHPHVFKPAAIKKGDDPKYSIELLADKTKFDRKPLDAAILAAIKAKWGPNKEDWPRPLKTPIRDGDKPYGKKREVKKEHKGMWVIKASSSAEYSKPYVVGRDPDIPLTNESELYPGCYGRAALKAHAYTFADKDGVKFILDGVQFLKDGEPLGGRRPANQMFSNMEDDFSEDDEGGIDDLDNESFDDAGDGDDDMQESFL